MVVATVRGYGAAAWNSEGASPYVTSMFTNWIQRADRARAANSSRSTISHRASLHSRRQRSPARSTETAITANVAASGCRQVRARCGWLEGAQVIKNVTGWYAYDNDSVFLSGKWRQFHDHHGSGAATSPISSTSGCPLIAADRSVVTERICRFRSFVRNMSPSSWLPPAPTVSKSPPIQLHIISR